MGGGNVNEIRAYADQRNGHQTQDDIGIGKLAFYRLSSPTLASCYGSQKIRYYVAII